jgi:hypothetical protein
MTILFQLTRPGVVFFAQERCILKNTAFLWLRASPAVRFGRISTRFSLAVSRRELSE